MIPPTTEAPSEREKLDCLVAAMLAQAVIGQSGATAPHAINTYGKLLGLMRKHGGALAPTEVPRDR